MTSAILQLKQDVLQMVLQTEDKELLEKLNNLLIDSSNQQLETLNNVTEEDRKQIEKGIREYREGNFTTSDEFWALTKNKAKWK